MSSKRREKGADIGCLPIHNATWADLHNAEFKRCFGDFIKDLKLPKAPTIITTCNPDPNSFRKHLFLDEKVEFVKWPKSEGKFKDILFLMDEEIENITAVLESAFKNNKTIRNMDLFVDRMIKLQKEVHQIATEHGWHEEKKSNGLWMCLVMTEVAEAVEADRKGLFGMTADWKNLVENERKSRDAEDFDAWLNKFQDAYINKSREAEMADIVIRLLDFANEAYGDKMGWYGWSGSAPINNNDPIEDFPKNAINFVKFVLGSSPAQIVTSIKFVYIWAEQLGFDLDWHIDMKMQFNRTRPYKHGGKRY